MSGLRPGSSRHAKAARGLGRLLSLYRSAGRAQERAEAGLHLSGQAMEQLEARILLGGDHPSFDLPLTPTSGTEIVIDGVTGEGDVDGTIEGVTPDVADDLFRFVAPQDDFVSVWADTINVGGSDLDSRVEVYGIDGNLISAGSSQGTLTGGFFDDGWTGFLAEAGETYFVRVLSDVDNAGQRSSGDYTIRVDAITSTDLVIETDPMAAPPARFGAGEIADSISRPGDDVIYRVEAGSDAAFDSLASFYAALPTFPPSDFDTRLDIYNEQGQFIDGDSLTGRLLTGFSVVESAADAVFFVRVRGDEFDPGVPASTGDYILRAEMAATQIDIDPVTRRGQIFDGIADAFDTRIYRFTTQGAGLTFAGAVGAGLVPIPQPALRMYNASTSLIGFSDLAGIADLQIQLETNTEYFIVIESFDNLPGGTYNVFVESNHTFIPTQDVDDHESRPEGEDPDGNDLEFDGDTGFTNPDQYDFIRPTFDEATPLRWSDPFLYTRTFVDPNGVFDDVVNPVSDRSYVQQALGTGRIHSFGDTDLFQFTLPVDMLGDYEGDNDDAGDAVFAGGQGSFVIKGTDNDTGGPITRDFLGIWDAQDWFPVRAGVDMTIYAMQTWEYDTARDFGGTALIIGGELQFADFQAAPFIAAYWYDDDPAVQEYVLTPLAGGAPFLDGPVFDFAIFDFDPDDDIESQLIVAGEFTQGNGIVQYTVEPGDPIAAGSFSPLPVLPQAGNYYAVEVWDPTDPDMGDENPLSLYFAGDSGTLQSIALDDDMGPVPGPTFSIDQGVGDGVVLDLKVYETPGAMPGDEPLPTLAVGGAFDGVNGNPVNNVFTITGNPMAMGPGVFTLDAMAGGTNDTVRVFEVWDRDGEGTDFTDELIVGGDFTQGGGGALNFIGTYQGGWGALGSAIPTGVVGFNGPVHSLLVFVDQEFGVGAAPFAENPVLYAGGEFTTADGSAAGRTAQLVFDPFLLEWTWLPMGFGSTDTVFALENFNDEIPTQWDRDDRRASRLQLTVSPDFLPGAQTFVRIYDSSFQVVYTNDTIAPPFPDPSGAVDPSLLDPAFGADDLVIDIGGDEQEAQFFAGETYYLEISSVGGNGRYSFSMVSDALPPDVDGDGTFDDVISAYSEPGGEDLVRSEFDAASEIVLSSTTFGDGRNFLALPNAAFQVRSFDITPSGFSITQYQELGMIERINDFDIFFFRAPDDGTTEVRLATQQISDEFVEDIVDLNVNPPALERRVVNKVYDSPLDGKIRIFNNDLQLVASNDDNPGFAGTRAEQPFGSLDLDGDTLYGRGDVEIDGRIFSDRDPRLVVPTERGEVYYIVVESGQLDAFTEDPDLVDWRRAIGSYELLINSSPNLEFADDHADFSQTFAEFYNFDTPLPIDDNGDGQIRGEIRTRAGGVEDNDALFTYVVGTGLINITVEADNPSEFRPRVTIFDTDGTIRVNPVSATSTSPAQIEFFANKGDQYVIRIDANVGEQGAYTVTVDGAPSVDDVADRHEIADAQEIEIFDFLGQGEFSGVIDAPGDTDIFRFTTPGYGEVTIDVVSTSFGFDPIVRIFEVSEDPAGNPILLTIGFNDDAGPGTVDARAQFPVTGADRTSNLTGQTYNDYYVVVEGANREGSSGSYDLTITADPTDDHPDAGEFAFASPLVVAPLTGQGERPGVIEVSGDTDLFTFNAPAGGVAVLSAVSSETSTLRPTIRIFDASFNPVINLGTGTDAIVEGPDGAFSAATYRFNVVRGQQYYVLVGGESGAVTTDTGAYSVTATTPAADPVANETEFSLAQQIILSTETGAGAFTDAVDVPGDTDLYFFDTIADASTTPQQHTVRVDATGQSVTPVLSIFDAGTTLLDTVVDNGVGDLDPTAGVLEYNIVASGMPGQRFFLQVELDDASMFPTGAYTISVEGPIPDTIPTPGDDHANRGQFSQATVITLDERTGDAEATGRIDPSSDSDLFRIDPAAAGQTFVQVVTPSGALLDVDVTIFEQATSGATPLQITRDTTGFQGVNAAVEFSAVSGATYYVLVSGLNSAQGEYTVRVDARPETFFLYYPEGFVNENVSEFISLSNPSQSQTVDYTIRIFYEDSSLGSLTLVDNESIAPGSRGGVTVAERGGFVFPGIVQNQPYSIVIESSAPLGATLSHYDFEGAIGEAFTPITSDEWAFGRLERSPGRVESFLVFFNPNDHEVEVTLTTTVGGTDLQIQQTVAASSRGGWELGSLGQLPLGVFGGVVTSAPTDSAITDSLGIVAALSHYDLVNGEAFGVLGDPTGGALFNVVPNFSSGSEVEGELVLYNPGDAPATVTITSDYVTAPLPSVSVNRSIEAGQTLVLRSGDLSLAADVTAGITITSTEPLAGVALERQNGDANAIATQNTAASTWFFGDAFLNSQQAGLTYFETLSFFNPTSEAIAVEITLFFNDGTTENTVRQVGAGSFNNLQLDAFAPILDRQMLNFFSIQVSSNLPLIASLTHYDLELDGGWTNAGAPLGLTNPLDRIVI